MIHGKLFTTQYRGLGFTLSEGTVVGAYDDKGRRKRPHHAADWRFVDIDPGDGDLKVIGGFYPTREALMADLPTFASERGYERC